MNVETTDCDSYSNDASLLLPSTAMTGTYRIMGAAGWSFFPGQDLMPPYFVVTGTADGTKVEVTLASKGKVVGGGTITETAGGGGSTSTRGTSPRSSAVSERVTTSVDPSSRRTSPVQVISGIPCLNVPSEVAACDHVEETVFPAETLGKHYVVLRPTGPQANEVGHVVRLFGNADSTTLTYLPSKPPSCPDFLNAGGVIDCGLGGHRLRGHGRQGIRYRDVPGRRPACRPKVDLAPAAG